MKPARSIVLSMRLPVESGKRLKRIANRHGWTASDASARLVEEGLRRSEFAFLDFRDSPAGRQAYIQGSTLAIWEVMLLLRSYKGNVQDVAKHLNWPEAKVRAARGSAMELAREPGAGPARAPTTSPKEDRAVQELSFLERTNAALSKSTKLSGGHADQ